MHPELGFVVAIFWQPLFFIERGVFFWGGYFDL